MLKRFVSTSIARNGLNFGHRPKMQKDFSSLMVEHAIPPRRDCYGEKKSGCLFCLTHSNGTDISSMQAERLINLG